MLPISTENYHKPVSHMTPLSNRPNISHHAVGGEGALALMLCQRIGPFDCLDFAWHHPGGLTFREFVTSKLEKNSPLDKTPVGICGWEVVV